MSKFLNKPTVNLKYSTILSKKFKTNLSGYDALEVDKFFDQVISDYKTYESHFEYLSNIIYEKINLINDKDEEIEKLKIRLDGLEERILYLTKSSSNQYIIKEIEEIKKKLNPEETEK